MLSDTQKSIIIGQKNIANMMVNSILKKYKVDKLDLYDIKSVISNAINVVALHFDENINIKEIKATYFKTNLNLKEIINEEKKN